MSQQYPSPYPQSYPPYPPPVGMPPGAGPAWGYSPAPVGRPGVLTAIGVLSIIVASLSMLASFGVGGFGLISRRIVQMQRTQAAAVAASARVASQSLGPGGSTRGPTILGAPDPAATSGEPEVGPNGMEPPDRRVVATALQQVESLTPDQLRQLDQILATAGRQILPAGSNTTGLTVRDVLFAINDHGELLSADPKDPDPVHFDFATGQLQLHADRALFRLTDRGVRPIASSAPRPATAPSADIGSSSPREEGTAPGQPDVGNAAASKTSSDPFAPDADSPGTGSTTQPASPAGPFGGNATTLNPALIQTVVQKIQAASGNKLNPAQLATLRAQLQQPNQQLVPPGMAWSPVSMAMVQPDGSAFIQVPGGYLMLDAQGNVTNQMSSGIPTTVAIHPLSMMLVLGEAAASLALAILLLVAGIMVLRQSPTGRRLHLIYALVKLPLAIAGGIGIVWLAAGMANTFNAAGGGGGASGAPPEAIGWGIALAVGGAIYPLALLIALNTRGVRDYYRAGVV
jgi:hypothetical protein